MVPEKKTKKNRQEQEMKISRITARGEKIKIIGQKERKGQPRLTLEKNPGIHSQLVQRKLENFRESCNATITKVLNTSGAN